MTSRALKLVLTLVLLLIAAGNVRAQLAELKNTTPEERAMALTAMMRKKLGLSGEEEKKVAEINLKYAKEMDPVIKGPEGPLMKMRSAREINERKEAELQQTLTADQFSKYLAAREEMKEKFEEKMEQKMMENGS